MINIYERPYININNKLLESQLTHLKSPQKSEALPVATTLITSQIAVRHFKFALKNHQATALSLK